MKINNGHYFEALDRSRTIAIMLEELLGEHPVTENHPHIKALYDAAQEKLSELYQEIGQFDGAFQL